VRGLGFIILGLGDNDSTIEIAEGVAVGSATSCMVTTSSTLATAAGGEKLAISSFAGVITAGGNKISTSSKF
jgi:hypothetical protein